MTAIDQAIAERIRARRRQLRMSQEALGEAAGVTWQQIQKYEMGADRISAGRLALIARGLDVPAAWFFEGLAVPPPRADGAAVTPSPDIGRDVLATRDGIRLVHAFAGITDKAMRAAILAAAEAAAKKSGERDDSYLFDPAATDAMR